MNMSKKDEARKGWAVVTGASSGLGAIFAEKLAERGLPLVLAGRDQARLAEVRQRVQRLAPGVDVELVIGDLGSQEGVEALVAALGGREVDVLINNAGFGTYGRLQGSTRPRPPPDRRKRRCVGEPHARGAARNAGTGARPDSERRVDHRVSARPVSGHLRGLEGIRAVVQPGPVGRDARLGCKRDRVVPRDPPARDLSTRWMRTCRELRSIISWRRRNLLWPQDFGARSWTTGSGAGSAEPGDGHRSRLSPG